MRYSTLFFAVVLIEGASTPCRAEDGPAVVRVLKGWTLEKLGGYEDSKTSPAVYMSLDDVAKVYADKEFLAKLDKEVDFSKNVLLRYAWKENGPPVSYEVQKTDKGPIVIFPPHTIRMGDPTPGSLELVFSERLQKVMARFNCSICIQGQRGDSP